jgi:DNA-binding GntR family transcriptional regulator
MTKPPQLKQIDPGQLKNLRDHVRDALRKAVLSGEFEVGQRLNERSLAEQLGVSTTPLKEAIRGLEAEGLLKAEPRRGVFVTFGPAQAEEMSLARAAIESMIARQATRHADSSDIEALETIIRDMASATEAADPLLLTALNTQFHDAIRLASRCSYLLRLQNLQSIYDDASRARLLDSPEERERALQEHTGIMTAIRDRDSERAERAMRDHIVRSGEKYAASLFGEAKGKGN